MRLRNQQCYPVDSKSLTRQTSIGERGNPISLSVVARQLTAKLTYGGVGTGGRKKRMPNCNRLDTGFKVTRHESEPTFDWSFLARELEEPSLRGKANDDNE